MSSKRRHGGRARKPQHRRPAVPLTGLALSRRPIDLVESFCHDRDPRPAMDAMKNSDPLEMVYATAVISAQVASVSAVATGRFKEDVFAELRTGCLQHAGYAAWPFDDMDLTMQAVSLIEAVSRDKDEDVTAAFLAIDGANAAT